MFQWICPECGQEIDPREKECSSCSLAAQPARDPELAEWAPWGPKVRPLDPEAFVDIPVSGPELRQAPTTIPKVSRAGPQFAMARASDYSAWVLARTFPAVGTVRFGLVPMAEFPIAPHAPVLPAKPSGLSTASVAATPYTPNAPQRTRSSSSWILSVAVAAGMLGFMVAAAIYAMPTLAGASSTQPAPAKESKLEPSTATALNAEAKPAEDPLAPVIEIAGIRFVTDIPGKRPEIHYVVVNHSSRPIPEATATVMLHSEDDSLLSQFGFRTPRLEAYESKEMVSSIAPLKQPAPRDWRNTRVAIAFKQ